MSFMLSRTARFQRAHVGTFPGAAWPGTVGSSPERHFSGGMAPENSLDRLKYLVEILDIYQSDAYVCSVRRSIAHDWPRTFLALQEEAQRHANQQFAPPAPDHGCLPAAIRHSAKTTGGNTGNTGNLPQQTFRSSFRQRYQGVEASRLNLPASAGNLAETGGNWRKPPADTVRARRRLYRYPRPVTRVSASRVSPWSAQTSDTSQPPPRQAPTPADWVRKLAQCRAEVPVLWHPHPL